MTRNIVVLSFTRMGDLIQSTPLLRSLRADHPSAKLTLVVLSNFKETASRLPMVDNVIAFDVDRFVSSLDMLGNHFDAQLELRSLLDNQLLQNIDLLVNLSHTRRSATLSGLLNPAKCVGMYRDVEGNLRVNNDWIVYLLSIMEERSSNPFNLVEIYRRIGSDNFLDLNLELSLNRDDKREAEHLFAAHGLESDRETIALQPGASHPARCWPVERYAELAERFVEDEFQVVVLGDVAERALTERLCELSNHHAVSFAGRTSVGSLSGVLARCKLLVTNDTGTAHIASALKVPVVGIFLGPASAKDTAPMGNDHVILEANLPCAPCDYKRTCANPVCKSIIDSETVYRTSKNLLNRTLQSLKLPGSVKGRTTRVDAWGQFRLLRIGGVEANSHESLEFYRAFWISFMSRKRVDYKSRVDGRVHKKLKPGLSELRDIYNFAHAAIDEFNCLPRPDLRSTTRLNDLLTKQSEWQNRLRAAIGNHPEVSPFCRFLLVKVVLARTASLSNCKTDLTEIMSDLRRGVSLMESMTCDRLKQPAPILGELSCAGS